MEERLWIHLPPCLRPIEPAPICSFANTNRPFPGSAAPTADGWLYSFGISSIRFYRRVTDLLEPRNDVSDSERSQGPSVVTGPVLRNRDEFEKHNIELSCAAVSDQPQRRLRTASPTSTLTLRRQLQRLVMHNQLFPIISIMIRYRSLVMSSFFSISPKRPLEE